MPKRKGYVLSRLSNFQGTAKHTFKAVVDILSPWKKRNVEKNKENENPFHCELNPIEQCWGYAKRLYRLFPESSHEDMLEKNALEALDAIPLSSIRRFATQSQCFMNAYQLGLNGSQAAWAARKYKGHRVLPKKLLDELDAN